MESTIFWGVISCGLLESKQASSEQRLLAGYFAYSLSMTRLVVCSSETSVNLCYTIYSVTFQKTVAIAVRALNLILSCGLHMFCCNSVF